MMWAKFRILSYTAGGSYSNQCVLMNKGLLGLLFMYSMPLSIIHLSVT